jgi:anti-anti-sigma factor
MRYYAEYPSHWCGHVLLVHNSEEQRRAGLATWARHSLDTGAKVLYVEPPHENARQTFLEVLTAHGVPAADALQRGQLEVFAATEQTYDATWQDAKVDEALAAGYPTVRWSGAAETAWGVMTPSAHGDVEWATDRLCEERPVSVLCQYPSNLPRATLETVSAMHAAGVREAFLRVTPVEGGVAIAGSVDIANERTLRIALRAAAATRSEHGVLVVDLLDLDFLDVAGARAFLTGTTSHRIGGGTLRLQRPRGVVASVLQLLRVDAVPGFEVTTS